MSGYGIQDIRRDCLIALDSLPDLHLHLKGQQIALTGGTGFLGSWVAEAVAALNDKHNADIKLHLFARDIRKWNRECQHLSERADIIAHIQDVRSPFEFPEGITHVVHAAGIPDSRIHASDPLRVYETTILGLNNVLSAASQLPSLASLLNVSSCLVCGRPDVERGLTESDVFPLQSGRLDLIYAEAKRAAESLAAIYRGQFRIPIITARPFTFVGPYHQLSSPWAINSFMRDVLTGNQIRIHSDGSARRSYLFGSDAAVWILAALVKGEDGGVYNVGSASPISHLELVQMIAAHASQATEIRTNTSPSLRESSDDLFPDVSHTQKSLGVTETCDLANALSKSLRWLKAQQN